MRIDDNSGVLINGVSLTTMGLNLAGPISAGAPAAASSYVEIPGSDGSLDLTLRFARNMQYDTTLRATSGRPYFGRRKVTVPLAAAGTRAQVLSAKKALGALLGLEVTVTDPRYDGRWRGPLSLSGWNDHHETAEDVYLSDCVATIDAEPTLVGDAENVTITSSPTSVIVEGNSPTMPSFTLIPTGNSTSIGVAVTTPQGNSLGSVTHTSSSAITQQMLVNCELRTMGGVGGGIYAVSINDDYPVLAPGVVVVTFTGCSQVNMSYETRWMV